MHYQIDLWQLESTEVDALSYDNTTKVYEQVINKMTAKSFKEIRCDEYWLVRDRITNRYEKMKLTIFCYLCDRDWIDVDYPYILSITKDERVTNPKLQISKEFD